MKHEFKKQSSNDPVLAVLCSDLHWSHKPPILRSKEVSWKQTQKEYMRQLDAMRPDLLTPIVVAGDITHKADEPISFVNFLLENHPEVYAIPGQHDLPYHRYDELKNSIYWTLVKTRRIINLPPGEAKAVSTGNDVGTLFLHGFPWGHEVQPCEKHGKDEVHLAVVHDYIWTSNTGFTGAPEEKKLGKHLKNLKNYDAAVFGDNHKLFLYKGKPNVINCGSFMRRNADEIDHRPAVGLLHRSGKITKKYLDVSSDRLLATEEMEKMSAVLGLNIDDFIEEVENLSEKYIDFSAIMNRFFAKHKIKTSVREFLLDAFKRSGKK